MTSNMVECFNNVLKGVRSLPVTAILKYTFIKLNEYFLKHSASTAKWIGEKMDYPLKVHDWLLHQARKSAKQQVITYNEKEMIYQIDEPGGTTRDGRSYGGVAYEVRLKNRWCQCERPHKYHWPCSHLMTATRARNLPVSDGTTVRLHEFTLERTRLTWAPRFNPFLDASQWPEYVGPDIVPDPALMVPMRGRRRKKRFRSDMDDLAGYTGMKQFGSGHFMEPPENNNCGECNDTGHNVRTCKKPRTNTGTSQTRGRRTSLGGGRGRGGRTSLGGGRGRGSGGSRTRRVDRGRPIDVLLNPDG